MRPPWCRVAEGYGWPDSLLDPDSGVGDGREDDRRDDCETLWGFGWCMVGGGGGAVAELAPAAAFPDWRKFGLGPLYTTGVETLDDENEGEGEGEVAEGGIAPPIMPSAPAAAAWTPPESRFAGKVNSGGYEGETDNPG